ncbi:sodium-dependent transporter [Uruburuella suis]|jgi:neurotransmitter:Na+ symporter, NSS family|uniref:Transporter n=1 Tax=Uruburuella suis TaxID=252130 RepID=A0AAE9GW68_9NEIS|nr:sodium-dependent transporter [Uruburuella suis]TCP06075.1 NSS family neurotransmitter:Na+ symporter [Uruburuella suis]UOO78953.1 sodium-dependent transporter [Uruburuella suis]
MKKSASWSSKIGFILSAAGSAIGLGAIWKFPYTAGTNGGAVFFLLFLLFTVLIGLPVLLAEFYIGRKSGKNAVDAFKTLAPDSLWPWVGRMGVAACFILLSFYSVVGGWVLAYVVHAFGGTVRPDTDFSALFAQTIANPLHALAYQALFMLITVAVVRNGISEGIEKASKYLMPALFVIFLLLAARSLTLPGADAGLAFLLQPDWRYLNAHTMLIALGQSFFALSIGVSAMITYAAYLGREQDVFRSANSVMWLNLLVSLLAGLVIFPAVFAFGYQPDQGPGLIFVVLPAVFQHIAFGNFLFAVFMLLVLFATLTSAFAMLETVIAAAIHNKEEKRARITWQVGLAIFIVGIPSALSFGVWQEVTVFGKTLFDLWDYLITAWIMPIGALCIALFVGWVQPRPTVLEHMHSGSNTPAWLARMWHTALRYLAPVAILIVFANTLGWI